MGLEIRPFRESDRAEVVNLWAETFPDEPEHNVSTEIIDRKLRVQPELFLVAIVDDVLVGTLLAGFDGVRGWFHRLAVHASAQRGGVGTRLVRHAETALSEHGCPKVNLQIRTANAAVIAFYRSLGYATEDRISMGKRI
jgi:hypothetical protein